MRRPYEQPMGLGLSSSRPTCQRRPHPDYGGRHRHTASLCVAQQARDLLAGLADQAVAWRFPIRDRDSKFTRVFDDGWRSTGAEIIRTPMQAPNANAVAERWVGTVRWECLDHLLITGHRHLLRVLHGYLRHDSRHRPHRSLDLSVREWSARQARAGPPAAKQIHRRDVLVGLIDEYERAA